MGCWSDAEVTGQQVQGCFIIHSLRHKGQDISVLPAPATVHCFIVSGVFYLLWGICFFLFPFHYLENQIWMLDKSNQEATFDLTHISGV